VGQGGFRDLPRASRDEDDLVPLPPEPVDELLGARDGAEVAGCPEDLRLGQALEGLGPQAEALLPVDAPVDPRAGDLGDLLLAPDEGRELGEELVENKGVLQVEDDELQALCPSRPSGSVV